jgi:hypothetical protein
VILQGWGKLAGQLAVSTSMREQHHMRGTALVSDA